MSAVRHEREPPASALAQPPAEHLPADWTEIYRAHFDFVWRSLRRLGLPLTALDDAAQEVFLIAFRKLPEFEQRSSFKTWLFAIAWRVARRQQKQERQRAAQELTDELADQYEPGPHERTAQSEAVRLLYSLLDALDQDKRAVFVMAELEQMTMPEIAEVIGVPLNTAYSRLRAARKAFDAAYARQTREPRSSAWSG